MQQEIKDLHQLMRTLILKSGIKEKAYDSIVSELENESEEALALLLEKLKLVKTAWEPVNGIWKCAPEHMWANYELHGFKDFNEINILKERLAILRKFCHENLKAKKSNRKRNKKPAESGSVQPEGIGTNAGDSGRGES